VTSFLRFLLIAGLINTLIASVMLCRLPDAHAPSLLGLLLRATLYVGIAALAGIAGMWWYWRRPSSPFSSQSLVPFRLVALSSATGWVWVPAVLLFSGQDSPAAAMIAGLGALILAVGLRRVLPTALLAPTHNAEAVDLAHSELFVDVLRVPTREFRGYTIAACIYATGIAYAVHENLTASIPAALCTFLFAWHISSPQAYKSQGAESNRKAERHLVYVALPAICVTAIALLFGVASRNRAESNSASSDATRATAGENAKRNGKPVKGSFALDGYESIVLWPEPPKKQIIVPKPLVPRDLHLTKPLVIRFNGAYWYFQPPSLKPGPHAHVQHGSPLAADIHSTTFIPLTMEAHQSLPTPLRLSCCKAMEVEIENRDNRPGALSVALLLRDTTSRNKSALYLGQQPIASSQAGHFAVKSMPVTETLHFAIPARATISRFDEITIVMMEEMTRLDKGSRVAVDQFELEPR
jgi:hypothetical protein